MKDTPSRSRSLPADLQLPRTPRTSHVPCGSRAPGWRPVGGPKTRDETRSTHPRRDENSPLRFLGARRRAFFRLPLGPAFVPTSLSGCVCRRPHAPLRRGASLPSPRVRP